MTKKLGATAIMLVLLSTACGRSDAPAANEANSAAAPANAAAAATNEAESNSAAANTAAPAAPAYVLAANGLGGDFAFGVPLARALELATAAFGPPSSRARMDCPQGAMETAKFGNLELLFDAGRFVGWTLDGSTPRLETADGVSIGSPRRGLGDIEVSQDRGFPEFSLGEIRGVLDDGGTRVVSLSAGDSCEFD